MFAKAGFRWLAIPILLLESRAMLLGAGVVAGAAPEESIAPAHPFRSVGFVENAGQWPAPALFAASVGGIGVTLERTGLTLALPPCRDDLGETVLRLAIAEVAEQTECVGVSPFQGVYHFYVGEASRWRTGVRRFERVHYRAVRPGIDLVVRCEGDVLEYDILVAHDGDIAGLVFRCAGADGITIDGGDLVIGTSGGDLRQRSPKTWIERPDGSRRSVPCRYRVIDGERYGFDLGVEPAPGESACIDPIIEWSTYFGGSCQELIRDIAFHPSDGDLIVSGTTTSANLPGASGPASGADAFVARIDPDELPPDQLEWVALLGGPEQELCMGLDVAANGMITIVGQSQSATFPSTQGALQIGSAGSWDAFVARFTPGGVRTFSSLFGGLGRDWAEAVDAQGDVITFGGYTESQLSITPNAFQSTLLARDVFIARVDLTGPLPTLTYSSYFGGSGNEGLLGTFLPPAFNVEDDFDLQVDAAGVITFAGRTNSFNNPVATLPSGYDSTYNGSSDVFIARLDPGQPPSGQLVWGTFLGSTETDSPFSIEVDEQGRIAVGGYTFSPGFPTTINGVQPSWGGTNFYEGFVSVLDPSIPGQNGLVFSTFVTGTTVFWGYAIEEVIFRDGRVIAAGWGDAGMPVTPNAIQAAPLQAAPHAYWIDIDPADLTPGPKDPVYGSYFGAYGYFDAIAMQGNTLALAGNSGSPLYPTTTNALQPTYVGMSCVGSASWQEFGVGDACMTLVTMLDRTIRGDCNLDQAVDVADAISVLAYLFPPVGITPALDCPDACDSNNDDGLDIADAVYLLEYLFAGGDSPPLPFPDPGPPGLLECY